MKRINQRTRVELHELAEDLIHELPAIKYLKDKYERAKKELNKKLERQFINDVPKDDLRVLERYGCATEKKSGTVIFKPLDPNTPYYNYPKLFVKFEPAIILFRNQIELVTSHPLSIRYQEIKKLKEDYHKTLSEKLEPYIQLINSTRSAKKILDAWPEAEKVLVDKPEEQEFYQSILEDMKERSRIKKVKKAAS